MRIFSRCLTFFWLTCASLLAVAVGGCSADTDLEDVGVHRAALCTLASASAAPTGPIAAGTPINVTANLSSCDGGEAPEYRFGVVREGTPGVTIIQDWGPASSTIWDTTGTPGGKYILYAYVRAVGTSAWHAKAVALFVEDVCLSTTFSSSPPSPQAPGTFVTLSAAATCTGGTAEYRFLYKRIDQPSYSELQGWSPSGTAVWNTSGLSVAKYNLLVLVRGQGNTSGSEGYKYLLYELGGVPELTSGLSFSCARNPTGEVRCWGNNAFGQHGVTTPDRGMSPGEMGDNLPSVSLGTGRTAKAIAAGPHHACAILEDDTVKCWGENRSGALGLGDTNHRSAGSGEMGDALPIVSLGSGRTAMGISAGYSFSCALLDNGSVKCWGANQHGQLGQGSTDAIGDGPGEMGDSLPPIDLGVGRTAQAITTGHHHACALLDDNSVKCWGYNTYFGVLGLGDNSVRGDEPGEMGDALPSVDLGAGRAAQTLTAGALHTCVLLDDQSVKCWGWASRGQLGLEDTNHRGDTAGEMGSSLPAVNLGAGRNAVSIKAGTAHTCAVLDNSQVKCWGDNRAGQLGLGDTNPRGTSAGTMGDALPTVSLGTGRTAQELSTGLASTCARLDNATLKCWGGNATGTLGLGDTDNRGDAPGEMGDALATVSLGSGLVPAKLPSGTPNLFSCALLSNGSVKCWGSNYLGELGAANSTTVGDESGEAASTVNLGTDRTATAVGAANYGLCVLLDNAQLKCMGSGSALLGQGDSRSRGARPADQGDNLPAIDLGPGRTAIKLAVGSNHACAILDNASLKCWGNNSYGQLGLGDRTHRGDDPGEMGAALPVVQLGTGRIAQSIFLGGNGSCALLDDGNLKCWGQNSWGRLGLGDSNHRGDEPGEMSDALPAVSLGTGRRATSVAVGPNSMCAILDDGTTKCWGGGGQGLLGNESTESFGDEPGEMGDALPIVDLGPGLAARSISVGSHHVCAGLSNDRVKCWGDGAWGQTGLGTTLDQGDQAGEMASALPFVSLGAARYVKAVSVGFYHSCSVFRDGAIKCWGQNSIGQLGVGDNQSRGASAAQMGDSLPEVLF